MVNAEDINLIMLMKPELVFFGLLSVNIKKVVIKSKDDSCYAYTDGKTIWYVCPEDAKLDIFVGLTLHCLLHIISLHYNRMESRNKEIWTIACDHVVNRTIKELNSKYCKLPANHVFLHDIHRKWPDITPEKLYDLLTNYAEQTQKHCPNGENTNKKGQKLITFRCKKSQSENGSPTVSISGTVSSTEVASDLGKVDELHQIDAKQAMEMRQFAQSLALNENNLAGMGQGFKAKLKKILDAKIPWEEILENALRTRSSESVYKTWAKKNLIFPKMKVPGNVYDLDKADALIVSVDLSGSISERQAEKFAKAVATSAKYYSKVIVLLHTETLNDVFFCERPTEAAIHDFITENYQSGDTSHLEVFKKIQEIIDEGSYLVSTILFLTDMISDIFEIYKNFRWPFEYESIWLLPPRNLSILEEITDPSMQEFFSKCVTKVMYMDD